MQYIKILAYSICASIIVSVSGIILTGHTVAMLVNNEYFGLSATSSSYLIDAIAWGIPAFIASILVGLLNPKKPKTATGITAALAIGLFIAIYYFPAKAHNPSDNYLYELISLNFIILYATIIMVSLAGAILSSRLRKPN
jgi:hypothetical protein